MVHKGCRYQHCGDEWMILHVRRGVRVVALASSALQVSAGDMLNGLVGYQGNHYPVSSLYLTIDRARDQNQGYIADLKSLIKAKKEDKRFSSLERIARMSLEEDWDRFLETVTSMRGFATKGIAMFSSSRAGIWQVFPLPSPVPNALYFGKQPYITPLALFQARYGRGLVLLVGRRNARLMEIECGIPGQEITWEEDVPSRVKEGGWRMYEEKRIDNHILYHLELHIRNSISRLKEVAAKYTPNWVIIGGSDEARQLLQKFINDTSPRLNILAVLDLPVDTSSSDLLRLALEAEHKASLERAEKYLHFLESVVVTGKATLGLTDTAVAAAQGRLGVLLVSKEGMRKGQKCLSCGTVNQDEYWQVTGRCAGCGSHSAEPVSDIINSLVHQAFVHKTEVCFIESGPFWWEEADRVGGILRY